MKPLLIHYINISNYMDMENVQDIDGDDLLHNYNVDNSKIILSGKDVFNSKNLICEKKTKKTNYFEVLVKDYLEDFKEQAPSNYNSHFHLVLPNLENYPRHFDLIPHSYNEQKKLIQIRIFPFCFQTNWHKFRDLYRKMIFSINEKELNEHYEFIFNRMEDQFTDIYALPQYDKDYFDDNDYITKEKDGR